MQLESREGFESGADAWNLETFGDDYNGRGWDVEDMFSANAKLLLHEQAPSRDIFDSTSETSPASHSHKVSTSTHNKIKLVSNDEDIVFQPCFDASSFTGLTLSEDHWDDGEQGEEDNLVYVTCHLCGATHMVQVDYTALGLDFRCNFLGAACQGTLPTSNASSSLAVAAGLKTEQQGSGIKWSRSIPKAVPYQ